MREWYLKAQKFHQKFHVDRFTHGFDCRRVMTLPGAARSGSSADPAGIAEVEMLSNVSDCR
jgi:hypothetical protein